jgi:hypothetical protein
MKGLAQHRDGIPRCRPVWTNRLKPLYQLIARRTRRWQALREKTKKRRKTAKIR